jgi:UDP-N-acetyl-D-glucosamine dehydrogenase
LSPPTKLAVAEAWASAKEELKPPPAARVLELDAAGISHVAVLGLGYVGLPTALAFHHAGTAITGIDIRQRRLADIAAGDVDLLQADRDRLDDALASRSFALTSDPAALKEADAVVICVPTPVDEHLTPDLGPLRSACDAVVRFARPGQVLLLTSTTYVGSTRSLLAEPLGRRGLAIGRDVQVAFSPERIDPGNATHTQDRVPRVVGGVTPACAQRATKLLARIAPVVHTVGSPEAAELTKLYENTFRAVNIALANELADISRVFALDVMEVIEAASTKPYGFMPFYPGPGVGGHCIPCDPHYLLWQLRAHRASAPVIGSAMQQVATRPVRVAERAAETLAAHGRAVAGARILVVGVTYKPGVADVRESPAVAIIDQLVQRGASVSYLDPLVPRLELPGGRRLDAVVPSSRERYDLVVVHCLHPGVDYRWVAGQPHVLDATYRFDGADHRVVV